MCIYIYIYTYWAPGRDPGRGGPGPGPGPGGTRAGWDPGRYPGRVGLAPGGTRAGWVGSPKVPQRGPSASQQERDAQVTKESPLGAQVVSKETHQHPKRPKGKPESCQGKQHEFQRQSKQSSKSQNYIRTHKQNKHKLPIHRHTAAG